jgi:hypothetical protein
MEPDVSTQTMKGPRGCTSCPPCSGSAASDAGAAGCPATGSSAGAAPDNGDRTPVPAGSASITASLGRRRIRSLAGCTPTRSSGTSSLCTSSSSCTGTGGSVLSSLRRSRSLRPSRAAISASRGSAATCGRTASPAPGCACASSLGQIPEPPAEIWCGSRHRPGSGWPAVDPLSPGAASPAPPPRSAAATATGCPPGWRAISR